MKKYVFGLILFMSFHFVKAQEELTIDYYEIKQMIEDKDSDYFYPKLLQRFNDFDSSLTLDTYALIYYGFSFQDDYLKNQPDEEILSELFLTDNYNRLIDECKKVLDKNPVSLDANYYLGFAYFKLGKPENEWTKYQDRFRGLRKAIVYSGNGLSCESAFKVIYVSDEYNVLYDYFDITEIYSQTLTDDLCDKFEVEPSAYYKSKEVYFDISRKIMRREELIRSKNK